LLEKEIGDLLKKAGLTLAVAESCTGGLLGHRITNVPGSSAYFLGGVIAYSNRVKEEVLGVSHETLQRVGAVSEETALQMARGVRRLLKADIGVAVTGIAGPTGGTPTKPVGLVYVAISTPDYERCEKHIWQGNREENKRLSSEAALKLVHRYLEEKGKGE